MKEDDWKKYLNTHVEWIDTSSLGHPDSVEKEWKQSQAWSNTLMDEIEGLKKDLKILNQFVDFCKENYPQAVFAFDMKKGMKL